MALVMPPVDPTTAADTVSSATYTLLYGDIPLSTGSTGVPVTRNIVGGLITDSIGSPSSSLVLSSGTSTYPSVLGPVLSVSTLPPKSTSSSPPASSLPAFSTSFSSTIHTTSPTPLPGGLSTSVKIGIGVGAPLGVLVLTIVAFLGYLYGKRRGTKRNAIPAADVQFHGFPGDKDPSAMQGQDGAGAMGPQGMDDKGELPRYAEELQGSPGVKRHELSAQRKAMGYFGPDVVTS